MNTSKNTFIALFFTFFSCGLLFSGIIEAFNNELSSGFVIVFFIILPIAGLAGLLKWPP